MKNKKNGNSDNQQFESMRQLTQNASLEEFVRAASHDIKNPLSIIIGSADIIATDRENMSIETIDALINQILLAGNQLNDVLDYMVDIANQMTTKPFDENGKFVS